jgi:hypothetical protein
MGELPVTLALELFAEEVEAVRNFDVAVGSVVDLIECRSDPQVVLGDLDKTLHLMAEVQDAYSRLEALLVSAGWSMSAPDELPPLLKQALDNQVQPYRAHLARAAVAEDLVNAWYREHATERYWAGRQRSERFHTHRARRRRSGD